MSSESRGARLHRQVVTYPDGRVGAGLLVLRCAVAGAIVTMILQGQAGSAPIALAARGGAAALATAAILVGSRVGPACILLMALGLAAVLTTPSGAGDGALLVSTAIALMLTGPGAYSLDARRHGRREIVVPRGRGRAG